MQETFSDLIISQLEQPIFFLLVSQNEKIMHSRLFFSFLNAIEDKSAIPHIPVEYLT
jgi:hypothetical protein